MNSKLETKNSTERTPRSHFWSIIGQPSIFLKLSVGVGYVGWIFKKLCAAGPDNKLYPTYLDLAIFSGIPLMMMYFTQSIENDLLKLKLELLDEHLGILIQSTAQKSEQQGVQQKLVNSLIHWKNLHCFLFTGGAERRALEKALSLEYPKFQKQLQTAFENGKKCNCNNPDQRNSFLEAFKNAIHNSS